MTWPYTLDEFAENACLEGAEAELYLAVLIRKRLVEPWGVSVSGEFLYGPSPLLLAALPGSEKGEAL